MAEDETINGMYRIRWRCHLRPFCGLMTTAYISVAGGVVDRVPRWMRKYQGKPFASFVAMVKKWRDVDPIRTFEGKPLNEALLRGVA